MPLIRVELFDYRVNEETSAKLIAGLTDALCTATHEGLRDHTWVIVEGHDPKNWGLGGKPWPVGEMPRLLLDLQARTDKRLTVLAA